MKLGAVNMGFPPRGISSLLNLQYLCQSLYIIACCCVARAKTRLPQAPDKCKAPRCLDLMPTFILIAFSHPSCGGAPIINFTLNLEDVTEGVTKGIRIMAHCNEFKLEGLKPGASYRMCIRADNNVGEGEFSNWTKVVRLPKDKTEIAERKLQQDL